MLRFSVDERINETRQQQKKHTETDFTELGSFYEMSLFTQCFWIKHVLQSVRDKRYDVWSREEKKGIWMNRSYHLKIESSNLCVVLSASAVFWGSNTLITTTTALSRHNIGKLKKFLLTFIPINVARLISQDGKFQTWDKTDGNENDNKKAIRKVFKKKQNISEE